MADGAGEQYGFKWTSEQTSTLIKLRGQNEELFTGAKNSATVAWRIILEKMGLQEKVTPLQAKEKWYNLKSKYEDCKYPWSGEGVSGKPTAETWPWFVLMDEVLGQRPSTMPPVLIASIPGDTPGPSAAVSKTGERERGGSQPGSSSRRRRRDDELLDLIREDMRLQREAEERRERWMERFLALMERMIEK
uniref:Myb/SANT-like DNA-binding domain-containing protein n=1 Tax=Nothobranchius korthausae TaxID=1143690 RepID=A0A1A8EL49_9TELE